MGAADGRLEPLTMAWRAGQPSCHGSGDEWTVGALPVLNRVSLQVIATRHTRPTPIARFGPGGILQVI
jgi:hypothetical protein